MLFQIIKKVDILKHEDQDTPEKDCDEGVQSGLRLCPSVN